MDLAESTTLGAGATVIATGGAVMVKGTCTQFVGSLPTLWVQARSR